MRIAVTGGLGRLGRLVVESLLPDHDAVAIDQAPADPALPSVQADVRDPAALRAALSGAEVVIHIGGIDRSVAAPDPATLQTNVVGTWNAFAASRDAGVRRVVLCSSTAVTGIDQSNPGMPPDYLPIDEDHALRPTDAYSVSKRAAELVAEGFARGTTLEVLTLRPAFIAFPAMRGFMAGKAMKAGRSAGEHGREEPMPLLRAYVGPADCAHAFALAATAAYPGFAAMFVAADDCFADQPTVRRVEALYGTQVPLRDAELYANWPSASTIASGRAKRLLAWRPTTRWPDLMEGASDCAGAV
jgi:UDP-glucose 4-epimerase